MRLRFKDGQEVGYQELKMNQHMDKVAKASLEGAKAVLHAVADTHESLLESQKDSESFLARKLEVEL